MSVDPAVVQAIENAVAADPDNVSLRVHLAQLLVDAGRSDDALRHARVALASQPADVETLGIAALAAGLAGDTDAERGYAQLLVALTGNTPSIANPAHDRGARRRSVDDDPGDAGDMYRADVQRPSVRLADVAGMAQVKERLEMVLLGPMRNPELRAAFGMSMGGGLLLYGPPGCGKTFLATALAGELGASFLSIGLTDVLDMWIGSSERNLHEIFETARRSAPCVLFLDEVDAIGQKRGNLRHSAAMRTVVTQLLTELDGAERVNHGVFVLGATNHPWDVDVALRRPGRFDRTVLVLPPDQAARTAILDSHLRGRPLSSDLDLTLTAAATEGFSGADLVHLCDTAAQRALAASVRSGKVHPIGNHDLSAALRELTASVGPWFDTARNYATFANNSGEYDDLLAYRARPPNRRRWGR